MHNFSPQKYFNYFFILALVFLTISCKKELKKNNNTIQNKSTKSFIKYAKGFDIEQHKNYTKLIIKSPYPDAKSAQEFILTTDKNKVIHLFENQKIIEVPLQKIIATSTTHIPMLEILGEEKSLIGFPHTDYISSEKTRKLIGKGKVKNIGQEQDFNTELILGMHPDAIIGFSMGNNSKMYQLVEKNGIDVIYNGEWLEETPLGRAEWIKFFGVLYNKNAQADSIFQIIEKKYIAAKKIAQQDTIKPTIFTGTLFKDKWNLPAGESFMAQLFKDANTNYIWKNTKGQGSIILSFESVLDKAKNADYWIGSGYFTSFDALANNNKHYIQFDAFERKFIYTYSKKRGANGGVLYFELAPIMPHIVLQDLIKVTHPALLPNYQPYFLEKLD